MFDVQGGCFAARNVYEKRISQAEGQWQAVRTFFAPIDEATDRCAAERGRDNGPPAR
jgi:Zn/Cd-binding protein ZinT